MERKASIILLGQESKKDLHASKWIKAKTGRHKMVSGGDIFLDKVELMVDRGIIGKFMKKVVNLEDFVEWCKVGGLEYFFRYIIENKILCKGWIYLLFRSHSNSIKFREQVWLWDNSRFVLKAWHPSFDSTKEPFIIQHLWHLFLDWLIEHWTASNALVKFGCHISKF